MTNATLNDVQVGDEILVISKTPAARVTVGIAWSDVPQRLVVKSTWSDGKTCFMSFENGGRLLPTSAKTPCVVA